MAMLKKKCLPLLILVLVNLAAANKCEPIEKSSERNGTFPKCTKCGPDINNTYTISCSDFDDTICQISYAHEPEVQMTLNCENSGNSRKCLDMILEFPHFEKVTNYEFMRCSLPTETLLINRTRTNIAVSSPASTMESSTSSFHLADIKKLKLIESRVQVSKDFFQNSKAIQEFHLNRGCIELFDFRALEGLTNLKTLELDFYQSTYPKERQHIENFRTGIFENYTLLEKLKIASAPKIFKNVSRSFYDYFPLLVELELPKNLIDYLPEKSCFANKNHLKELDLSFNSLEKIPEKCFENLLRLETLRLNDQATSLEISKDLFKNLRNLKVLDLAFSGIKNIPDKSFINNNGLKYLDLSGNSLTNITEHFLLGLYNLRSFILSRYRGGVLLPINMLKNMTKLEYLDLSYNDIALATDLLSDNTALESLNLAGNRLSNISRQFFMSLHKLRDLYLSDQTRDIEISSGLFDDLSKLENLDLSSSGIKFLPSGIFDKMNLLRSLNLERNEITHFPTNLLNGLHKLRTLNLHFQHVRNVTVPREFFRSLGKLEELDFSYNNIEYLPPNTFDDNLELKKLTLAGNNLKDLPETLFFRLTGLESLRMNIQKSLITIPKKLFKKMKMLKVVDLSKSGIHYLPDGLFSENKLLTFLDLSDNYLTNVSAKLLRGASGLETLIMSIQRNPVVMASGFFDDLEQLKKVDLSRNNMEEIPENLFSKNKALMDLNLEGNRLTQITKNAFSGLHSLIKINLENNNLQSIDHEAFADLVNLEEVRLLRNSLVFDSSLPYSPFYNNSKMKKLELFDNAITKIFKDWQNSKELTTLNLSHNNITKLNAQNITFASRSITVDLTYNPISRIDLDNVIPLSLNKTYTKHTEILLKSNDFFCDCSMLNFLGFVRENGEIAEDTNISFTLYDSYCSEPKKMDRKYILNIDSASCAEPAASPIKEVVYGFLTSDALLLICCLIMILGIVYIICLPRIRCYWSNENAYYTSI